MSGPYHPEALRRALSDRAAADGLSQSEIARRARDAGWALSQSRVNAVFAGTNPNPGFQAVAAILAGLGRDLFWLADALRLADRRLRREEAAGR